VASYYWSSTAYAYNPSNAWLVDFYHGSVSAHSKSYNGIYVRAVCGRQCRSLNNYVDNGDGTVTDTDTGLMWQQATAPGAYTWQQALSYCENLTLAGYPDWRLPNRNELQSLVDYSRHGPSIDTAFFPNTLTSYYWSSTTIASTPSTTWLVIFDIGMLDDDSKSYYYNLYHVRAVRAGQCESLTTTTTTIGSTTTTTVPSCPSEQIYGEYSDETEILRYLRDNILNQTPEGQELIRLYYEWSPMIVKAMEADEVFKNQVKEMIEGMLPLIIRETD